MSLSDSNMKTNSSITIEQFCSKYEKEILKYSDFFLKAIISNKSTAKCIINNSSILEKYREELEILKVRVELSNEEYMKYRFNPKLLSHDLYGTTELWFLILDLNEIYSISSFNLQTLWLYSSDIYNILSAIITNEKPIMDYNAQELQTES